MHKIITNRSKKTLSLPKPIHSGTHIGNSLQTPRLPAETIYSILQYTTIHHGYQPKLSIVYYSVLQYTTAASRNYL